MQTIEILPPTMALTIARLLQQMTYEYPPRYPRIPLPSGVHPLGTYLLACGYLAPEELMAALKAQADYRQRGVQVLLGELLVRRGQISATVLAGTLLLQLVDRWVAPEGSAPQRLGERLLMQNVISPAQLFRALESHTRMRLVRSRVRLGEVLVGQGALSVSTLNTILTEARSTCAPGSATPLKERAVAAAAAPRC